MASSTKQYEETIFWKSLNKKTKREVLQRKQNLFVHNGRIYDEDGVDVSDIYEVNVKMTPKQAYGLNCKQALAEHETENDGFVFAFFQACKSMSEQFPMLSQSDLARLMFISTFIGFETDELLLDNGKSVDKKTLQQLLSLSRSRFSEFYNKLLEHEILREGENGELSINGNLFYRGRLKKVEYLTQTAQFSRVFRKTVRDLYGKYNGRSIRQLALIYMVLPYVNFNYNIICYNPAESNYERVNPMTAQELSERLGYGDYRKLTAALRKIKYKGQSVFGFFEVESDKRKRKIVVNPNVVYAGNGEELKAIKILFK